MQASIGHSDLSAPGEIEEETAVSKTSKKESETLEARNGGKNELQMARNNLTAALAEIRHLTEKVSQLNIAAAGLKNE